MQIHFKGTNYDLPRSVSRFATKKLESLDKYMGRGKEFARAYIDLGKESEAHQNGKIWRADVSLDLNGTRFYAKAVEENIEKAIDQAINDVAREIRTARRREQSLARHGGAMMKSFLRGFQS